MSEFLLVSPVKHQFIQVPNKVQCLTLLAMYKTWTYMRKWSRRQSTLVEQVFNPRIKEAETGGSL